jgi:cysteine desulfurase / selenocysteine lyase
LIDNLVKLISITHIPTNGGLVNPAAEIGSVAKQAGIPYLIDGCQSVGQLPIDVDELGCDMLSTTGRKYLRGPRGTGFLCVRQSMLEKLDPPFLDLHAATWTARDTYTVRDDARLFENWETNYAAKVGLGVAIDYALDWGLDDIWERVSTLAKDLRACLSDIAGVTVLDLGEVRCGIVTFSVAGLPTPELHAALSQQRINTTISGTSSTRLDMEARGLSQILRASVHYYNPEAEVERFCDAVAALASQRA